MEAFECSLPKLLDLGVGRGGYRISSFPGSVLLALGWEEGLCSEQPPAFLTVPSTCETG